MIQLRTKPNERLIELGGGSKPVLRPKCLGGNDICVDVRMCFDEQGNQTVDFTADFNEILPIESNEFDGAFCQFVIEHLSWRKVTQFISEIFRILKPGGKAVLITANTLAQFNYITSHQDGWDNKTPFESFSCIIFGDQDYPENTHRNYLTPYIANDLFSKANFVDIKIQPFGTVQTDMLIEAVKPTNFVEPVNQFTFVTTKSNQIDINPTSGMSREEMFDKSYFNGGGKVGGYSREGYWDYPVHEITARHILDKKPSTVLEIGCARGYILKRIQDAGIPAYGMEISKHCYMTRVADNITRWDVCKTPWPFPSNFFDLCFSVATLEHIPEEFIYPVLCEMRRVCRRGLHGIDFGERDDGFDKTHCTLKPASWWKERFTECCPISDEIRDVTLFEVVNKEELEQGVFPPDVLNGDGKVKLNVGSFTTMFHHGWINIDVHDLNAWAQGNGYRYQQHDVRNGLPYPTGGVDYIFSCHMLEHLTYEEGLKFLKECRRVLNPTKGAIRILVPDAGMLMDAYVGEIDGCKNLTEYNEINDGCAKAKTAMSKLHSLLYSGHNSCYDKETLSNYLTEAGFSAYPASFRNTEVDEVRQILRETLDMLPCLTLYMDATPSTE